MHSTIPETPACGIVIIHIELSKAITNISLQETVWCGVNGDQLIGLYAIPQRLTTDIYANFLQTNCRRSYRTFLYKDDVRRATSMTERRLISVATSGSI